MVQITSLSNLNLATESHIMIMELDSTVPKILICPEDEVINPSSLTKFRKLRLKDMNLLDMLIAKTVQLTLEKGIIKSKYIIMDATHTKSKYNQKTPPSSTPGTIKKTAP